MYVGMCVSRHSMHAKGIHIEAALRISDAAELVSLKLLPPSDTYRMILWLLVRFSVISLGAGRSYLRTLRPLMLICIHKELQGTMRNPYIKSPAAISNFSLRELSGRKIFLTMCGCVRNGWAQS